MYLAVVLFEINGTVSPINIITFIKVIIILLLDYVIAFYPLLLTIFILVGIELNDRIPRKLHSKLVLPSLFSLTVSVPLYL